MRSRFRFVLLVLGMVPPELAMAAPSDAGSGAETPTAWEQHPLAVEGHFGFGAPLGMIGAGIAYSVAPVAAIHGGLGLGSGRDSSLHYAIGAYLRPVTGETSAWVVDLAYSGGSYQRLTGPPGHHSVRKYYYLDSSHWVQMGTGFERQWRGGPVLRIIGGAAALLNPGDMRCIAEYTDGEPDKPCPGDTDSEVLPYFEVTFGHAFSL